MSQVNSQDEQNQDGSQETNKVQSIQDHDDNKTDAQLLVQSNLDMKKVKGSPMNFSEAAQKKQKEESSKIEADPQTGSAAKTDHEQDD